MEKNNASSEKVTRLLELLNTLASSQQLSLREDAIHRIQEYIHSDDDFSLLSLPQVQQYLSQGLDNLKSDVGNITLSALTRLAENENYVSILDSNNYFPILIGALQGKDIGTAEKIANIFVKMSSTSKGLSILFRDDTIAAFRRAMRSSDEIKFRILDLFANVSASSTESFSLCESNMFLKEILDSVNTNDILQQMNGLELLDKIVKSSHGATFLENSQTISKLTNLLKSDDDVMIALLAPKIISFLGELGSHGDVQLDLFEKCDVLPVFKHILDEGSNETKAAVVSAIGRIGSTPRGLQLLSDSPAKILPEYIYHINVEGDLRIIFLHSLAHLFKSYPRTSGDVSGTQNLRKFIEDVPNRSGRTDVIVSMLMPLLRQPFTEQRYAVLDLMSGLACHAIGAEQLLKFPGFFEFITNRNAEETKIGKEWQFFVIQNLVKTIESNMNLLEKPKLNELIRYLRGGVFFVKGESRVDIATKETGGGF